jgi:carbamoyl-phosphate synthase large subunit
VTKKHTVLVLGSGALKIGQAGEFDYSGSQAIKALSEEGFRTVVVNPNVATVQTTPGLADEVYLVPVEPAFIAKVIEREKPKGILLSVGGQTALNAGITLWREGVLADHGVEVLGTPVEVIEETEDRERFAARMKAIGVRVAESRTATTVDQALAAGDELGYPVMMRSGFSLGGLGSGVLEDRESLRLAAQTALAQVPHVLVEEFLGGWKEVEYEVIRDRHGNAVTVCNMENFDPMGVHTGESIVVTPSQTLTNEEYHRLRSVSLQIVEELGIVGECNVQFALDSRRGEYRVIEVNARLSRSSALASKATGYPLAWVSTLLALGRSLADVRNAVTGVTGCFFEPALDYVTVKMPRWDLQKFRAASRRIGSEMKSVGEVMAIGGCFEEALQKAVRSLGLGWDGVTDPVLRVEDPHDEIARPTDRRLFAIAQALGEGTAPDDVVRASGIDPWFVDRIARIVDAERALPGRPLDGIDARELRELKRIGFSDVALARSLAATEEAVRSRRESLAVKPVVRRIDTLAGEFPAVTNYLYVTYGGSEVEVTPTEQGRPVVILGSGPYCIGSSVEFDWCSVGACRAASELGHHTILINCNPETVSTDYDVTDRLYFEELTLERVLDVIRFERPLGVIVSVGGQIPNTLASRLEAAGAQLLGTPASQIDRAENRHKFSALLDTLEIGQPAWQELTTIEQARRFAADVGYPVLVRPSYVLSGSAMNIAKNERSLEQFLEQATDVSPEHPVVISKFIEGAKEIEIDAVAQDGELVIYAISEHVELSGVHSGDATVVLPPQRTWLETVRQAKRVAKSVARGLRIHGPFNLQLLARDNRLRVIECNLRASRSFPFVSKATGYDFIDIATRAMLGQDVRGRYQTLDLDHVAVKAPQFSFSRLKGADPVLYVEMTSTGEVACLGDGMEEAWMQAALATGLRLPERSILVSIGSEDHKMKLLEELKALAGAGYALTATRGTHAFLAEHGIEARFVHKVSEQESPDVVDLIRGGEVDCVINVPLRAADPETLTDGYRIRRGAADVGVPLINDTELARLFIRALLHFDPEEMPVRRWSDYHDAFLRAPRPALPAGDARIAADPA